MASNRNNKRWPLSPKHPNMLSFHIFDQAECDWKRYLNAFLQNLSTVNFNAHIYFSSHHMFTLFIFRIWLFEEIGKIPSMGGFTLAPQREYQKPYSSTFWTDAGVNQQWNIYHISYMQYIWNGDHVLIYPAWHKYWAIDKSKTCHWRMFWILSTVSICKAQRVLSYKHSRYFTNERIKKIYLKCSKHFKHYWKCRKATIGKLCNPCDWMLE